MRGRGWDRMRCGLNLFLSHQGSNSLKGVPQMTPEEKQKALMEEMGLTQDEAAHFLVDAGEIDSTDHADLLTDAERERVYGG